MQTMLLVMTMLAVVVAIGLGVVVWHLRREERLRADARVAALVEGFARQQADDPIIPAGAASHASPAAPHTPPIVDTSASDTGQRDWLLDFAPAALPEQDAGAGAAAADADTLVAEGDRGLFGTFAQAERDDASNRLMTAGLAAALLVGLVLAIWTVTHLVITAAAAPPAAAVAAAGTRAEASPSAGGGTAQPAPLELLTLDHAQTGNRLTISGRVRNPPNGTRQDRIAAIISFFTPRGDLVSSVRAPLDFRALAPGDESPFQASTATPAGASRFRVSFRREDDGGNDEGAIVPHVDRRQQAGG